ncbi:MAG TPA: hypothetical protein VFE42_02875 [Chloroflexota bacterium]|nr:hypothetical protein [Chloroflexota bacterium]
MRPPVRYQSQSVCGLIVSFPDRPKESVWLIPRWPEVEVCIKDYGFEVDLLVTADLLALTRVYLGRLDMLDAIKAGRVDLDGPLELRRAFLSWIGVSGFVRYGRPQPSGELQGAVRRRRGTSA